MHQFQQFLITLEQGCPTSSGKS